MNESTQRREKPPGVDFSSSKLSSQNKSLPPWLHATVTSIFSVVDKTFVGWKYTQKPFQLCSKNIFLLSLSCRREEEGKKGICFYLDENLSSFSLGFIFHFHNKFIFRNILLIILHNVSFGERETVKLYWRKYLAIL